MQRSKTDLLLALWLTLLSLIGTGALGSQSPLNARFYPLNLAYLLLPPALARLSLGLIEQAFWVSGLYLLARARGASRLSALLGATLGAGIRLLPGLTSPALPWLPWLALCVDRALRHRRLSLQIPWALPVAPLLALVILGDDKGTALVLYLLFAVLLLIIASRQPGAAGLFGAALILALGLSAPQLTIPWRIAPPPYPLPAIPWQALGHGLVLYAWLEAWRRRDVPLELAGLAISLIALAAGLDARALWLLSWSLSAVHGAESVRALRLSHGPDGGQPAPRPNGLRRWLLLQGDDVPLTHLAALAFWGGIILTPLNRTALAWALGGIVLRVARCPIYLPRWLKRRPIWEGLALGVSLLALIMSVPALQPTPAALALQDLLRDWWTLVPMARPSLFVTFLSSMSLVFLTVLWIWYRFYGTLSASSDLARVARNSSVPVVLNLLNRGMDFAYAALLLMRILGPANAGDYSSAIVIYTWLEILVNFGLDAILIRDVARTPTASARYLYNAAQVRIRLWLLLLPVVGAVCGLAPLPAQTRAALAMLYAGLLPATLCRNFDALFYAHEQVAYPALVSSIASFIKVSLGALVLLSGRGIVFLAANALITNLIVLAILYTLARHYITPIQRLPDAPMRHMLRRSAWPLMLRDLLYALYFRADLLMLQLVQNSMVAGWYSVTFKFLDTIAVIPQYFALALFPILARQAFRDRERFLHDYRLSVKVLLSLAFPLALGVSLYAQELVLILGDVQYLPHSAIALRLTIWVILWNWINTLGQYALIALQRQQTLSLILGTALVLSIVGNLVFIPQHSYLASALLKVGIEALMAGLQMLALRYYAGYLGWFTLIGRFFLIALVSAGLAWLAYPLAGRLPALLLALAIYGLLLWYGRFFSPQEWLTLQRLRYRQSDPT